MIALPNVTNAVALIVVLFVSLLILVEIGRRLGVDRNTDGLRRDRARRLRTHGPSHGVHVQQRRFPLPRSAAT